MRSKLLFISELLAIAAIFYLDYRDLLPVSKVPYLFLLGWVSIRLRALRWRDVGLCRSASPLAKIVFLGLIAGIGMEALELLVTQPLLTKLFNQGPDLHELGRLIGNWKLLILGIALSWVLAAFGEESVYRGYLTNRVAEIFGASKNAWVVAALLVTLLFGFSHFHQGPTGVVENIIDGAILALLYFATGRNLWAPILAHGIQDTIDVLLIYLGIYPGLSSATIAGIH
ncbi:MAG TPA: CPBP family intramembrane glutamic endopeptidase [Chthoniobacterales bacterium]|nr:CPBP family intramembrane glutamic endopeptidase [Chthoniobacterales bacterium]